MKTLMLNASSKQYPIHIASGLLEDRDTLASVFGRVRQVALVTNDTVAPLYLAAVRERLAALGCAVFDIVLPDGEQHKNWETLNRIFDGLHMSFDESGRPTYGRLQTDRPVAFEFQGTYELPWGTGIGTNFNASSGTPLQDQATIQGVPVLYKGRGNLGRTPAFVRTDLSVWHNLRLPGSTTLQLVLNVDNLFDQDTATGFDTTRYRDSIPTSLVTNDIFFAGFDTEALAATRSTIRPDPLYLQPNAFMGAREIRVMAKFRF